MSSGSRIKPASTAGRTPSRTSCSHPSYILPIPGATRIDHLEENLAAERLHLTPAHRDRLDRLTPSP
ncbi:hypothetical protein [Streptomyces europaeiscabiei]|uniref:hypothetical protein n=1 Tax=Streptomyces europaeiscabiei TaxID=146819 RepID=UPI002E287B56|nr:hypothetical protein [Streptomyces europaeiscabiei]